MLFRSELGTGQEPTDRTELEGIRLGPPDNPLARQVALIGSASAVGLLGLTLLVVYTLRWRGRHRTHESRVGPYSGSS